MPKWCIPVANFGALLISIFGALLVTAYNQNPNISHTGLRIYDDQVHCLSICNVQRFLDEHLSIAKIMHLEHVEIQFYNEINVCQAFGMVTFNIRDKHDVHALLGNPKTLYKGDFDNILRQSLDNFQFSLGINYSFSLTPKPIEILVICASIHNWQIVQNTFFGIKEDAEIKISDLLEGKTLELEAMVLMESLFSECVWRSPQIWSQAHKRELIDIFAYSEYGIFLIEAKALGILNTSSDISMSRKVANLNKDISKGIKQLIGASRTTTRGQSIFSADNNEIIFERTLLPHGIILVSELLPFGDWKETINTILHAMLRAKIYIHVMDMSEFIKFVGYSKGDKNKFDYFLIQRIENFIKNPSMINHTEFING